MMRFDLNKIANFVIAPQKAVELSSDEWFHFILILREAKLLASFYHLANQKNCFNHYPEYAQRHLTSACVVAQRQKIQVIFECATLTELLAKINVSPVYMKGANYILRDSINSRGRMISDIDVLVDKQDLQKVEGFLKKQLWHTDELSDYDEKYYRSWAHEIPPMYHLLRDTVLDIHHNIYLPISGRSPNINTFTKQLKLTQKQCLVLEDAATVLHSIIHLFMNEDFTNAFRDMLDLHLLFDELGNDDFWRDLNELAYTSGFHKELYYCLVLRQRLFHSSNPEILTNLNVRFKNATSTFFIHQVLYHGLTPQHYLLDRFHNKLARFVIFIRGHWIKMPLPILLKHLTIKSYLAMVHKLLGKHFLEKD